MRTNLGSHETHAEGDIHIAEDHEAGTEVHGHSQLHGENDDGRHIERPFESFVGGPHSLPGPQHNNLNTMSLI